MLTGCGEGPAIPFKDRGTPASQRWSQVAGACDSNNTQILSEGYRNVKFFDEEKEGVLEASFATGRTCIHRPLKETWAVLHSIEGISWDGAGSSEFALLNPAEDMQYSFKIRHRASIASWWLGWNHRLISGDAIFPEQVQIQFYKIGKARFIDHWSGEILLEASGDKTAALMDIELAGTRIDIEKCLGAVHTQFDRLKIYKPDYQYLR